jgi:hypothetical protein
LVLRAPVLKIELEPTATIDAQVSIGLLCRVGISGITCISFDDPPGNSLG